MSISRTQSEVITNDQFETTRPKRMRPRAVLRETEAETKTNTVRPRPRTRPKKWSPDHPGLETLTSLFPLQALNHRGRTSR